MLQQLDYQQIAHYQKDDDSLVSSNESITDY